MTAWDTRTIGRTGLRVSTLGLGTATMGGSRIPVPRAEREALVRAAWDAGVRYVDTAPFYGVGAAEHAVGNVLRDEPREDWVLSTKVGRLLRPNPGGGPSPDGRLAPLPFRVESTTTRMTASCARWRTACSASASRGSTSCMCTTSAPTSTGPRRRRRI